MFFEGAQNTISLCYCGDILKIDLTEYRVNFVTNKLLAKLDINALYAKDDGLRTIDGQTIHDIESLKPGQVLRRKWPYLQNVYYEAQVVRIKVDRGKKSKPIHYMEQNGEAMVEFWVLTF